MVADDVVDLADPETREAGLHPRFDARVLDARERRALDAEMGDARHRLRWTLWAAKESAFKLARKLDARAVFAPARFRVRLGAGGCGEVACAAFRAALRVELAGDALHAIATLGAPAPGRVLARVARVRPASASAAARQLAVEALARRLCLHPAELTVARAGRVPLLRLGGEPAPADLSLSHHGRFAAFAAELLAEPAR